MLYRSIIASLLMAFSLAALSAPKADLWPRWEQHDAKAKASIDHSAWSDFLQKHIVADGALNRVRYGAVSAADRTVLDEYVQALQSVAISEYNRDEQLAYWINLYNAATIKLILDHYPLDSITDIKSGLFSFGPWDKKLLKIDGKKLSLNDIEHRILRPIFSDPRIHYAVNCASIGCPDLAAKAYTAGELDTMLDAGARRFVNHPRGVRIEDGELIVSSIYEWFKADFGGDDAGVIAHLKKYADKELKQQLARHDELDDHEYDWALNDLP